jgi:hypothetical protein
MMTRLIRFAATALGVGASWPDNRLSSQSVPIRSRIAQENWHHQRPEPEPRSRLIYRIKNIFFTTSPIELWRGDVPETHLGTCIRARPSQTRTPVAIQRSENDLSAVSSLFPSVLFSRLVWTAGSRQPYFRLLFSSSSMIFVLAGANLPAAEAQSLRDVATGSMACLSHQACSSPKRWLSL